MNQIDPATWCNISDHPTFSGSGFDPKWYDGDAQMDLRNLKSASLRVLDTFPGYSCKLCVLDDCTMYVEINSGPLPFCELHPSMTARTEPCYFLAFESEPNREIRVKTVSDVVAVLRDFERGIDLSVHENLG